MNNNAFRAAFLLYITKTTCLDCCILVFVEEYLQSVTKLVFIYTCAAVMTEAV